MTEQSRPAVGFTHDLPPVIRAGEPVRWRIGFTVHEPLEAGAEILLGRSWPADWGRPQWDAPDQPNYVFMRGENAQNVSLSARRDIDFHPYDHLILLTLVNPLAAGSRLELAFGDARSAGIEAQTFIEDACTMRVLLRRPGAAAEALGGIVTRVAGSSLDRLVVTAPSICHPGRAFQLHVRAQDRWGNPASDVDLLVSAENTAASGRLQSRNGSVCRLDVTLAEPGIHRIAVRDENGRFRAVSNPLRCHAGEIDLYWGDLHAQSSVGCGAQSVAAYYTFARDFAATDFGGHQGNCFLITAAEWDECKRTTRELNEDGRFVALLGYEWSGPTSIGGDHNIYYPGDDGELRRCSHRFLADKSDADTDLPHVTDLHDHVRGKDMLLALHVGGHTSNLDWHEPSTERLLEVHSTHATSEWLIQDSLRRGYRFGFTGGSDGVDGRLGGSHPGRHQVRNLRGGLTAVRMPALTRADLWRTLHERRTYATNGPRILLEVGIDGHGMGEDATSDGAPRFTVSVEGTAPLTSVELYRGNTLVASAPIHPADPTPSGWLRLSWFGATGRGNWWQSRMAWDGSLAVSDGTIRAVRDFAPDTPAEGLSNWSAQSVAWTSITAGNWNGVEIELEERAGTKLSVTTEPLSADFALSELGSVPSERHLTDPDRKLRLERLPKSGPPLGWSGELIDPEAPAGVHPYWVRVAQDDTGMAWLSPIHVTVRPRAGQ